MPTIRETRRLKQYQSLLDPYVTRAREIQTIREAAKLDWPADASTDAHSHFWGALGELLVADVLGTDIDDAAKYSDGGVDGIFRGRTYDVKLAKYLDNPILKVWTKTKHFADLYILVAVSRDALLAELVGWATQDEVRRAKTRDFGHGENYVLSRQDLHPFAEIWSLL